MDNSARDNSNHRYCMTSSAFRYVEKSSSQPYIEHVYFYIPNAAKLLSRLYTEYGRVKHGHWHNYWMQQPDKIEKWWNIVPQNEHADKLIHAMRK